MWATILDVLDLHLEPDYNTILPMYVALLQWAVVAVALLTHGRWRALVVLSSLLYLFGQAVNGLAESPGGFQLANWQLLFTAGLLVGWEWEHALTRLQGVWGHVVVTAAALFSGAMFVASRYHPDRMEARFGLALGKANGGWLAFLDAAAVLVVGYAVVGAIRRAPSLSRLLRPLEILGCRGLPGYVAMVLAILALDFARGVPRNDLVVGVVVLVCGVAEYTSQQVSRRRSLARSLLGRSIPDGGVLRWDRVAPVAAEPVAVTLRQ